MSSWTYVPVLDAAGRRCDLQQVYRTHCLAGNVKDKQECTFRQAACLRAEALRQGRPSADATPLQYRAPPEVKSGPQEPPRLTRCHAALMAAAVRNGRSQQGSQCGSSTKLFKQACSLSKSGVCCHTFSGEACKSRRTAVQLRRPTACASSWQLAHESRVSKNACIGILFKACKALLVMRQWSGAQRCSSARANVHAYEYEGPPFSGSFVSVLVLHCTEPRR